MMISYQNHIINLIKKQERLSNKRFDRFPRLLCKRLVIAIILFSFLLGLNIVNAQNNNGTMINRGYKIKAAYLYNFCKYVEWPSNSDIPNDTFVIGIVETDPFGESLKKIARVKKIKGKTIIIRYIDSIDEYKTCHIIFIPAQISKKLVEEIIDKTHNQSILLIGEEDGFANSKGIINFIEIDNKIRFEINTKLANNHNLKISAKLLKIGKLVKN